MTRTQHDRETLTTWPQHDREALTACVCYLADGIAYPVQRSYDGDGGSLAGGVDAAMGLNYTYVAIANNPWDDRRFAFKIDSSRR